MTPLTDTSCDPDCSQLCCEPDCVGRNCGDDGCGGSCGTCEGEGWECDEDNGRCGCAPGYEENVNRDGDIYCCGGDYPTYCETGDYPGACWGEGVDCESILSCGDSWGACTGEGSRSYCTSDDEFVCCVAEYPVYCEQDEDSCWIESIDCEDLVDPCAGRECGPDGLGGTCGPGCTGTEICNEDMGQCVSECGPGSECAPGDIEYGICGRCGTREQTCSASCTWGSWSACSGEGVCWPDASESRECADGSGTETRTCTDTCSWGTWGPCECASEDFYLWNNRSNFMLWSVLCGNYWIYSWMQVCDEGGTCMWADSLDSIVVNDLPWGEETAVQYWCCNVDPVECNPASTQRCTIPGVYTDSPCLCDGPFDMWLTADTCPSENVDLCY